MLEPPTFTVGFQLVARRELLSPGVMFQSPLCIGVSGYMTDKFSPIEAEMEHVDF